MIGGGVLDFQVSPDRRYVAYRADQDVDQVFELYVVRASDRAITKVSGPLVAGGRVEELSWALDSSRIGYLGDQDTNGVY